MLAALVVIVRLDTTMATLVVQHLQVRMVPLSTALVGRLANEMVGFGGLLDELW